MRLVVPLVLLLALASAGCTADEPITPAAEQDDEATGPTPEPTPPQDDPPPTQPTPSPTPSTTPTPSPSPSPDPGPEPEPPTPRPHHHEQHGGWVEPNEDHVNFTTRLTFPVHPGAANATIAVAVSSTYPPPVALPRETANLTVVILDPSGERLAGGGRSVADESPGVAFELASPLAEGEYVVLIRIQGGSDGATMGDRWAAVLHVEYD